MYIKFYLIIILQTICIVNLGLKKYTKLKCKVDNSQKTIKMFQTNKQFFSALLIQKRLYHLSQEIFDSRAVDDLWKLKNCEKRITN